MALTGWKNPDGSNQLECQVKKAFLCRFGIHTPRMSAKSAGKRCIHCNHIKPVKVPMMGGGWA